MQIPILNGIYTDAVSDFRVAYPCNLVPVPVQQGISNGYLKPAEGVVQFGSSTPPGADRGSINWDSECYRVMGTKLIKVSETGAIIELGTVAGADQVSLDYSFDYLGVAGGNNLYLWNGASFQQVTDTDLGTVVDFIWVDGYFLTTDGENLVVTELADPFSINPLKYGSSEVDPDPIKAILKLRNEPYVLNRYTTEAFENIGGDGFPFQRIDGAQITRGVVGTHACCVFVQNIAFLGGGRNEAISVWLGANGASEKISNREVDLVLAEYSEEILADTVMESKIDKGHQQLWLHLPDLTLVYDAAASLVVEEPVWFRLSSSMTCNGQLRARNLVRCYNKWIVGDPKSAQLGYLSDTVSSHWGDEVGWEFNTLIIYNEGRGAIFHELELVGLTGRVELGDNPTISTCYSLDGETWSQEKFINVGLQGNRKKRLVWLNQGPMHHWRIQQFRGTSASRLSVARLEARLEPLAV